ncbi:3-carboxyethylcatechol 2,3-dioxygenase [Actinomycetospora termitidis]|uniref:2,3-dihydroxyphenylpropionate/2,3-dihydroxicinnamic acid 1,2-dioxygenase n=1 Tax=Actinomycetospora termitidis TaxID=3053470 RepID=A0ABT7MIA0_9PSEU|nr:3-carboxyethylcatechol 2,3-dioxygenase [Actinomycetospora sp. Odt1-22]MDL5159672.1 3-carboxyethylcatechol 2,3-dioxygenase [Actinomycetospora sp. Odt1-22]
MLIGLVGTSHSPLMTVNDPAPDVRAAVDREFEQARAFVASSAPDLVVVFTPDHYNGVFYDMMPPFCIGQAAQAVGDYGTEAGPLDVPADTSRALAQHVLDAEIDVAISERMHVDHGCAQPLGLLFGSIAAVPTIPVFINAVATPIGPAARARRLGSAIGTYLDQLDERVLLVASGGLSHDPPVPELQGAAPEVAERLIAGRNPTTQERAARERRVRQTGLDLAAGTATIAPLNPDWDDQFLDLLAEQRLGEIDGWSNQWCVEQAGHSSHEVRTWIAAYAALAVHGPYEMRSRFYRAIPEWIAGFALTTAVPR